MSAPPPLSAAPMTVEADQRLATQRQALLTEHGKAVVGQQEVIDNVLLTIFCGGHGLIEGVPGLAKTLLIRSLGRVLDLRFSRIQFTPDLMPSDITGTDVLEPSLYALHHGGASHDAASGARSIQEIKDRGRWSSDASLRRYRKTSRAQAETL